MNAYIVAALRSAVGKGNKGFFRNTRPDDLAARVIQSLVKEMKDFDITLIDDVIVGNAMPEAEQGLNMGRFISLIGLGNIHIPGMTINRYCSSGLESIAVASAKIHSGMADCIIAGGVENMSAIPIGGWRIVPNSTVAKKNPGWYYNMGLTAERVAELYKITRTAQDEFSYNSHQKALIAIKENAFTDQIIPLEISDTYLDESGKRATRTFLADMDEGPRADTSIERLGKLKPVFAADGTVTAGNSSQVSDGAAFVILMSERMLKKFKVKPIARLVSYAVTGVEPELMGIGPVTAIPKALKLAGLKQNDIDLIELNEAFAAQSLAVMNTLKLNPDVVNVNGGAIALGHPLGCTGAKLSVQVLHELKKRKKKYGMVTMCVGIGQGAAGIFEII